MEILQSYIVIVVAALCWCIGYILRHMVKTDKINRFIPLIVGCLGVLFNVWASGWHLSPEIILGGLASGLASTGANELFRHLFPVKEARDNDE